MKFSVKTLICILALTVFLCTGCTPEKPEEAPPADSSAQSEQTDITADRDNIGFDIFE